MKTQSPVLSLGSSAACVARSHAASNCRRLGWPLSPSFEMSRQSTRLRSSEKSSERNTVGRRQRTERDAVDENLVVGASDSGAEFLSNRAWATLCGTENRE